MINIKLKSWADNWLINLNIVQCKAVSNGRNVDNNYHYSINILNLKIYNLLKILVSHLIHAWSFHYIQMKKNIKAYSILGVMKRNCTYLDKDSFLVIYKSMVRSHLEYANCIWSPYTYVQDNKNVDKVQMRETKVLTKVKHL